MPGGIRQRLRRACFTTSRVAGGVLIALLAACGDAVTDVPVVGRPAERAEVRLGQGAPFSHPTSYACFLSVREPRGATYRFFLVPLHFAPGLEGGGGTTRYRYRGYQGGGELAVVANCIIPRSPRAAAQLTRRLRNGTEPQGVEGGDGGAVIQSCVVTELGCLLPPLIVNSCQYGGFYPDCREPLDSDIPPCMDGGGCGGSEPVAGVGGGGGTPCLDCFPPEDDPCKTGYPLLDDTVTQNALRLLWNRSNYGPNIPMLDRWERGGWLVRDPVTLVYRFEIFPDEWSQNCRILVPEGTRPPPHTVALVHSHPFRRGERMTTCPGLRIGEVEFKLPYRNATSFDDDSTIIAINTKEREAGGAGGLVGIMIDADSITAFSSTNDQVKIGRCGYPETSNG